MSTFTDKLVSLSGVSFGSNLSSPSVPVGSMTDHNGLESTFHGSRILKGNTTVNQSLSLSFDPAKLVCVSCIKEHKIFGSSPTTIFFSDQNFVAKVEGAKESCLCVCRLEDASLTELLDLSLELFENVKLPEGWFHPVQ